MNFGATSTADEVLGDIDLDGRTVVVTGAGGGLGFETARSLAARGAAVVLAARDAAKLAEAAAAITAARPDARIETLPLDLASLSGVRAFADAFAAQHDRLDLLINNAGVMCTPFGRTADGFETQFGTNHLGHFLLTQLLTPALLAAGGARVVNVSSAGHRMGDIDFADPNFEHRDYDGWAAYGQSKTANILHAVGLDKRLGGEGVRAFAVHPGTIQTGLGKYMSRDDRENLRARIAAAAASSAATTTSGWKSVEQGAATSVWAATSPSLDGLGGRYCEDCHLAEPASGDGGRGYQAYAVDPVAADRLWELSERLVAS